MRHNQHRTPESIPISFSDMIRDYQRTERGLVVDHNDLAQHEDDNAELESLAKSRRKVTPRSLAFVWKLAISVFLLFPLSFSVWQIASPPVTNFKEVNVTDDGKMFPVGQLTWSQRFRSLPCGASPTEALRRGCEFDIVATAWLPPRCIDYELVDEFRAFYTWEYYSFQNGTGRLLDDAESLGRHGGLIWTTHRWHSAHCLFMWKKLNRALLSGRPTDGETIKQGHTDHCTKSILNGRGLDEVISIVEIIYPPC